MKYPTRIVTPAPHRVRKRLSPMGWIVVYTLVLLMLGSLIYVWI